MRHAPGALVIRYARALFEAARDLDALGPVRSDLQGLSDAWRDNPELALLLMNPRLSRDKVRGILFSLADRLNAHDLTRRFLNLLLEKDRLDILGDLGPHFEKLWREHAGEIEVTVVTALPVSENLRGAIHDHLAKRSGKKPLITWNSNPSILGGIVVQWPDHIFDGSLARKLENLKAYLAQGA